MGSTSPSSPLSSNSWSSLKLLTVNGLLASDPHNQSQYPSDVSIVGVSLLWQLLLSACRFASSDSSSAIQSNARTLRSDLTDLLITLYTNASTSMNQVADSNSSSPPSFPTLLTAAATTTTPPTPPPIQTVARADDAQPSVGVTVTQRAMLLEYFLRRVISGLWWDFLKFTLLSFSTFFKELILICWCRAEGSLHFSIQ
jgi:hypothetical protein